MIKLEISGTDTADFAAQLAAVAQLMSGTAAPAPATTGRGKGKTTPETPAATGDPTGGAGAAAGAESSGATGANDAPVTRESVATKCTQYGSPQKGGPAALKQLFVEFGSANGKWSEITDDKLVALNARLDDLLA